MVLHMLTCPDSSRSISKSIVGALRDQYANEMEDHWRNLDEATAGSSVKQRVQSFVDLMVRFMQEHPAYASIIDAPTHCQHDKKIRYRLRAQLANVFGARKLAVSQQQAYRVATVSLQMIKSMNSLYAEVRAQERPEIVKEYKLALAAYLELRL